MEKKNNKKNSGFSVIEIVLVLGVIGILSSFIAPKVRDYMAMAKDSKAINVLQSLRMANESYYLEKGSYITIASGEGINDAIKKIDKYLGGNVKSTNGSKFILEIGGSKATADAEDIIYGGDIEIILENGDFKFKLSNESAPKFNIRGDEWTKL